EDASKETQVAPINSPTLIPLQSIQERSAETEKLPQEISSAPQVLKANNIQELLKASFQLPKGLEEQDLWTNIEGSLDKAFHEQMFSENAQESWTVKEKYFVGLSEFLDGEVSAKKAQQINDHLLECAACRKTYLSFSKLKQILKYSYQTDSGNLDSEYFWSQIEYKLFPAESNFDDGFRRVQGF
ncbi:MAG: zf-HC2 domain-containing protein, partial [Candidatus Caenarcaniphilales bacterium]|nr:zf-HC2 domain-containing protein [Candidatus Caenarcaniphilales bacterium]